VEIYGAISEIAAQGKIDEVVYGFYDYNLPN